MASGGIRICHRSGKKIYPADTKFEFDGMIFHSAAFTCKETGVKLTRATAVTFTDAEGNRDVYLRGKDPQSILAENRAVKPTPTPDAIDQRVAAVPDSNMNTNDRKFNIAGKAEARGCTDADAGSQYGLQSVAVVTQSTVPDSNMRTNDRKFNIAGKAEHRGNTDADQGNNYGLDGKVLQTQLKSPQAATKINNINLREQMHNGVEKITGMGEGDTADARTGTWGKSD